MTTTSSPPPPPLSSPWQVPLVANAHNGPSVGVVNDQQRSTNCMKAMTTAPHSCHPPPPSLRLVPMASSPRHPPNNSNSLHHPTHPHLSPPHQVERKC